MNIPKICVGDLLTLKKAHPCGSYEMRVARVGSDVRIICVGCGRDMTLPRPRLEKAIKKIESVSNGEHNE